MQYRTEPTADTGRVAVMHEYLPRDWKKADMSLKQFDRFSWKGSVISVANSLPDSDPSGCFWIMCYLQLDGK